MFTAERRAFRSKIHQIARYRILNELSRRERRPQLEADPEGLLLANLLDNSPEVEEIVCREPLYPMVDSALKELSPPQREALGLVFLQDLTHAQVAAELGIPLGTAKTRIRTGLRKLRCRLIPVHEGARPAVCSWTAGMAPRLSRRRTDTRVLPQRL